jgi:thiol-disulfide isomerase/thioredoxin
MKKLIYVLSIALAIIACSEDAPIDYVTLSGKITNQSSDSLIVRSRTFSKKINVNPDGTFSDTLKIETGIFNLFDGNESTSLYLKNGFDLVITLDTKQFDETIGFKGFGAEANNYLAAISLKQEAVFENESLFDLEKPVFDQKVIEINESFKQLLTNTQNLDSTFIADQIKRVDGFTNYISGSYEEKQYLKTVLAKGEVSPKFVDYENYKGGTTSLDDLKGKYVYIDVWATWCGPCKAEIPFLKEVEKAYHDKNIAFLSVSIDEAKNHDKWKEMVADKELGGIQVFADNDWKSEFVQAYKINGIPRFILIDPTGNIVAADAPRPSSEELKSLLNELNL